jgi:Collagen triple helix repeat (20 copies)
MLSAALRHLRGNLVAYVALLVALSGTSYAAATQLLPRNSVGTAQVINGSLQKGDLSKRAASALRGPRGPRGFRGLSGSRGLAGLQGPPGPQGPQGLRGAPGLNGTPGVQGPRGPSDVFYMFGGHGSLDAGGFIGGETPDSNTRLVLPPGAYVAEANATFQNASPTDDVSANCNLQFERSGTPVFIDFLDMRLDAPAVNFDPDHDRGTISGAFELQPGDGPLRVSCLADPVDYADFDLFAVRVDRFTEAGDP